MTESWSEMNQRGLSEELSVVLTHLQRYVARSPTQAPEEGRDEPKEPSADLALNRLCETFGLSAFERSLLLLCAGVELDARFAPLCAEAAGDPARAYPTFSLALAALPGAHWNALTPAAALRRWRLIEVSPGAGLTISPLRIDERALHYLTGVDYLDERLMGLIRPAGSEGSLVPSHQALADQIAAAWAQGGSRFDVPIVHLCGEGADAKRAVAAAACARMGLRLSLVAAESLPTGQNELESLTRLWEREAALTGSALLLDCDGLEGDHAERAETVTRFVERMTGPFFIASPERRRIRQRPAITLEVGRPVLEEQRTLWESALGAHAAALNGSLGHLIAHFDVGAETVRAASLSALSRVALAQGQGGEAGEDKHLDRALWDACRVQARSRLDNLAQRIDTVTRWEDLVLPDAQRQILRDVLAQVRGRSVVYQNWGYAGRGARGLGVTALFSGESGTGKTTAAEVLAHELKLDLYRIDLSAVVSKYIGESEKNLRRVFDAAEEGGAILLFDEADALFGKRSEVKDSHDRYANLEVSYLLQRMESYRGLAILTTNLKASLDVAFMRRIRFVVHFPFPTIAERTEIWRRVYPPELPTEGLVPEKLARLNVAGGTIRNIALSGAFLAAEVNAPVQMTHLLRATQTEYAKMEKTLTETEVAGWVAS